MIYDIANDEEKICNAAWDGSEKEVIRLWYNMVDINRRHGHSRRTPLHHAVYEGNKVVFQILLGKGADPIMVDSYGRTPLHSAALRGQKKVVQHLLDAGEDPNKGLTTPLHEAASFGHTEIVQILLKKGASPHITNVFGRTPKYAAYQNGHHDVAKILET